MDSIKKEKQKTTAHRNGKAKQLRAFAILIVLTALAFIAVGSDVISTSVAIPLILFLAGIQVFVQLYTFMHLDEKRERAFPAMFMIAGLSLGLIFVLSMWYWKG